MSDEKISDCWQTPRWLFDELDEEFNFDVDLTANEENSKCDTLGTDYLNDEYATLGEFCDRPCHYKGAVNVFRDLVDLGFDGTKFMNPPYSNPKPFIEKAWKDSKHCKIVCLVKCDPSTQWWSIFWNYNTITLYKCKFCTGKEVKWNKENRNFCCPRCNWRCGNISDLNCILAEERGPKPGCEVRFFPKRIQFDPPQQLIDSVEVYDLFAPRLLGATSPTYKPKWLQKCKECDSGTIETLDVKCRGLYYERYKTNCNKCKGKGYAALSGPTFPCALIIMDRRGL